MSGCAFWRGQWLLGLRSDAKCAPVIYGCARAPYRVTAARSASGHVSIDCTSPWLAIAPYRGLLYLDGRVSGAVLTLAAERIGRGGFPLGGARRAAQLAALARRDGAHVFEYDFADRDARRSIPEAIEAARALVVAVAWLVGARLPGLFEGPDTCGDAPGWCVWAPGCCLPDVRGRAVDREGA